MSILYDMLAPGGLLLATNVSDAMNASRPFRFSMEYLLDWHLLYRDAKDLAALAPDGIKDSTTVFAEDTGLDVFLLVRRLKDA